MSRSMTSRGGALQAQQWVAESIWSRWLEVASGAPNLNWFALADSAQDARLPGAIAPLNGFCTSLLGAKPDSPVGKLSPWLVGLPAPRTAEDAPWNWLQREVPLRPACLSLLASRLDSAGMLEHLQRFLDVDLGDQIEMVLAYWDPAILGSLVGQVDDTTLHVQGPILDGAQRQALLEPLAGWWYCDRVGHWREIALQTEPAVAGALPLRFTTEQTDALVEASVPDHVLYHLQTNQPLLLESVGVADRYDRIRGLIASAREHGLQAQRDLVNFCCMGLVYGERMRTDEALQGLLSKLKQGKNTLDELLPEFPE